MGADVLIGMDIITQGDVAITNLGGNTVFSFRIPSQKQVDFVQEHAEESRREQFSHGGSKKNRKKRHKGTSKNWCSRDRFTFRGGRRRDGGLSGVIAQCFS